MHDEWMDGQGKGKIHAFSKLGTKKNTVKISKLTKLPNGLEVLPLEGDTHFTGEYLNGEQVSSLIILDE